MFINRTALQHVPLFSFGTWFPRTWSPSGNSQIPHEVTYSLVSIENTKTRLLASTTLASMFADFAFLPGAVMEEFAADLKSERNARHRRPSLKVLTCFLLTLSAMLRPTVTGGAAVSYCIPRGHHVGSEMDLISRGCGLDKHSLGPRQGHHMENVLQLALPALSPSVSLHLWTFCFATCQRAASVGASFLSSPVWPQSGSGGGRQVRSTGQEERTNGRRSEDDGGGGGFGGQLID